MKKRITLLIAFVISLHVMSQDSQETKNKIIKDNYQTILNLPFSGMIDDQSINDRWPLYINGKKGLDEFISREIKYPESAKNDSVKGTVVFDYVITKKGTITKIRIKESPDVRLSNEVIRVMKLTGPWIPGIKGNEFKSMRMSNSYEYK